MTHSENKISIAAFGCGNMAAPILIGLWEGLNQSDNPGHWTLYTPSQTKALVLADKFHGSCLKNLEAIPQADVYILGMKPQQLSGFAEDVRGKLSPNALVISMLAGVSLEKLEAQLGHSKVLRLMPNTPSHIGLGVLPFYAQAQALNHQAWPLLKKSFESFNKVISCRSEEELNLMTPYSGSGPAYFYEFVRIMADDLRARGVDGEIAQELMIHTCLGAAQMMAQSHESPELLRDKVTSKGGVTAKALEVFQRKDHGLQKLVHDAMNSALLRNSELND